MCVHNDNDVSTPSQLELWSKLRIQNTGCLKFMVLFFYRRLKADEWRQTVLTVKRLFWINGLAYLALFLTAMLGCRPYARPLPLLLRSPSSPIEADCVLKVPQ